MVGAALLAGCGKPPATPMNTTPVDLAAGIQRAKAENKMVLLEFGSSDSCPPCVQFERKVFSRPEFLAYAASNLVFLRLDFPFMTEPPPAVRATNELLLKQFEVEGFPTFIALDGSGKEFWRMPRKNEATLDTSLFNPRAFIDLIETVRKKQ